MTAGVAQRQPTGARLPDLAGRAARPPVDPARGLRFRPEVEGLRAVAVLLVFANHLFGRPIGGFTGVDVFFVISGFLITGLLLREYRRTRRISIKNFYMRRARRILPGAVTVLAVTAACAALLFLPSRAHQTFTDEGWAAGFLANVHFAAVGTDYFNASRPPSPVQHFWSLSVEEQFYVVWPLLLFLLSAVTVALARRHAHRVLTLVLVALGIAMFVLAVRTTRADATTAYFATTARAWELGLGAVLAVVLSRREVIDRRVRVVAFLGGLVLIAYAAVFTSASHGFPAPDAAPAVIGAGLIIIGGTGPDLGRVALPLTNPVSRYVGRVSYSLYLWHWPVIIFLPAVMDGKGAYFDVTAICLAFGLTVASFHFVEEPLRRMDYRAAARTVRHRILRRAQHGPRLRDVAGLRAKGYAALSALTLVSVGLVALAYQPIPRAQAFTYAFAATGATRGVRPGPNQILPPASITDGIESALTAFTFPKLDPSVDQVNNAHGPEWKTCGNVSAATLAQCTFPATAGPRPPKKLVVLGDSFGIAWTPTMRAAQAQGYTVYELTHSQCPAIDANFSEMVGSSNSFVTQCNNARNWYVSEIAKLKPDIVVIGNYDAMLNNLADKPKGSAAVAEWASGAKKIIDRVRAAGAKRIVWMASPPPSANLAQCAQRPNATPAECVGRVGNTWHLVTDAETKVTAAEHVTMLDTSLFFCRSDGYCPAFVGTTPTHTEGHHLTGAYAKMIGPDIIPYVIGTKRTPA